MVHVSLPIVSAKSWAIADGETGENLKDISAISLIISFTDSIPI